MKVKHLHFFATIMLAMFLSISANAQAPVNYSDVGVIVDMNDSNSTHIARYFQKKRNIPETNMLYYDDVDLDNISGADFQRIRGKIEAMIIKRGLTNKLNYLVTTLGVPYTVTRVGQCDLNAPKYFNNKSIMSDSCSSFDSEIGLILGGQKTRIGKADALYVKSAGDTQISTHPYYNEPVHFSKKVHDMYLVTRLTGFDTTEVYKLIDRSGPNIVLDKSKYAILFDDQYKNISFPTGNYLSGEMRTARDLLTKRGWNVVFDSILANWVDSQTNLAGYTSWGTGDQTGKYQKGIPYNTYVPGALSNTYFSYAGKSQQNTKNGYSLATEQIKEGACGSFGNTLEPFSFAMAISSYLWDKYTDTTVDTRYNLAESYWGSIASVSWFGSVMGDPKTSIISHFPSCPSPTLDTITVFIKGGKPVTISAKNTMQGWRNWFKGDSTSLKATKKPYDNNNPNWRSAGNDLVIKDTALGTYTYTFVNQNIACASMRQITFKVVKVTDIYETHSLTNLNIYPNPTDGNFFISLENAKPQNVLVEVKDMLGRNVYTQLYPNAEKLNENIRLQNAKQGIYIISIISGGDRQIKMLEVK
ncbi:MAG: TIGR03790 family protein [Bacteroidetes bacterium]|nr:TIGR03790 family protein [Bacteroidota bacterium]